MLEALCLPNLKSNVVNEDSFWDREHIIPKFPDKEAFRDWVCDTATEHCVYSFIEGRDPTQRIRSENPPTRVRGVVLDYDAHFSDEEVQAFVAHSLETDYPVNLVGRSYSGGIHAVWLFERPLPVVGIQTLKAFMRSVVRKVRGQRLARGLDQAYTDPAKYYTVGGQWQKVSSTPIPFRYLSYWLYDATSTRDLGTTGVEIPLDRVYEEVERRFPGRWSGAFTEGARGVRFWDNAADNETAAVVRSTGMQCFTGHQPFYQWVEIFGPRFVEQFMSERIGRVIADYYYDGRSFWHAGESGQVQELSRSDMSLLLKVQYGLKARPPKGGGSSEHDKALAEIITSKRVDAALPFVFNRNTIVEVDQRRYFNTSSLRPMGMEEGPVEWGRRFGLLAHWLEGLFGPEQLRYFLSWASRFYQSAVDGDPATGQALFIVGEPDSGKTLLNTLLLSRLFGGHRRAANFLLARDNWNGDLFEAGLWSLDDEVGEADRSQFSARLKEFVANYDFRYSEKFRKGGKIIWKGRLVSTLNDDPISLQILPDLDMNLLDKIMIFKVTKVKDVEFTKEQIAELEAGLPFLARYLYHYEIPEDLAVNPRFGVRSFIHPDIHEKAMMSSSSSMVGELVRFFIRNYAFDKDEEFVELTTPEFMSRLQSLFRGLNSHIKMNQFRRGLSKLAGQGHPNLTSAVKDGSTVWRIYPDK